MSLLSLILGRNTCRSSANLSRLELNAEERALYNAVAEHAKARINRYMARGTEMKNVSAMLTMLLRLRQVCNHPYLIRMPPNCSALLSETGS